MRFPRRPRVTSLRTQLMLSTAAPVIALLLALSVVSFFGFTRLTQALVERRDAELVQLAAQQMASYWSDSVLLLTQVASTEEVRSGDVALLQILLESNAPLQERFDQISVADAHGNVIATVGGNLDETFGHYDFFERTRQVRRPVRSSVLTARDGHRMIVVAIPYFDTWRQFGGCVLGIWRLSDGQALASALNKVRVGEAGFSYLVDPNGIILSHPEAQMIGADAKRHPAVASVLTGNKGANTINDRGHRMVVGYAPIPLRQLASSLFADETWDGWGLLTSELWDDIVAPLQPYIYLMAFLLIGVVAMPLMILALGSQRVTAPLGSLVEQVERLAEGDFDTQVSLDSGPSEVRNLERAFNRMAAELQRYRLDIQRYVVSILNSQEEERKRIARELHDETAQALIILGRRIEDAESGVTDERLARELSGLRDMVDDTLHGVRRFTSDLRPPLLEELGLSRTLEILGRRAEREGSFDVEIEIKGDPKPLLPELELGLYRLAQESFNNARRHAEAQHVTLSLIYDKDRVILEVEDDGVGFEVPRDPGAMLESGRLGLIGIHERARLFGGRATITSKPGQGTVVRVIIPLSTIVLPSD